ncbi:MAG TPA: Asp-tRNA(Asn)/Glu-tRNA(Gln) amidotransferase subunit GatC [Thermoanaerobaculia bacterium]|nr:Asp-tRNA(Asn)/Glu-tRNA(Gln) amidotransferase subunit GatC [Thermoanaerobaculia bacterium]
MADRSSPVDVAVVRRVAALARLDVPEKDLSRLTGQLARIVSYIDQLKEIPEEAHGAAAADPTPLRADLPVPGDGQRALETNAPRSLHGYGVVPRIVGDGE